MSSGSAFQQSSVVSISATTTSTASVIGGGDTAIISNLSTGTAYVSFGAPGMAPVAAIGSGFCVLAGQQRAVAISPYIGSVAVILSSGSGSVYIESGNGSGR